MLSKTEIDQQITLTTSEGESLSKQMESCVQNENWKGHDNAKKVLNKVMKRLDCEKMVAAYLETNPTEDFILKEQERLINRVSQIDLCIARMIEADKGKKSDIPAEVIKKKRVAYEKEQGIPKLREQQKCIKFILGK